MSNRALHGLLEGGWHHLEFGPFREGIEIHHLERGAAGAPSVALLRYAPGAAVPRHIHEGLEVILVLDGAQSDEHGTYETGALVMNPAGTSHAVWSETGCVVLVQWDHPVRFVEGEDT